MAAAIMLYTCETCVYKRLNDALRKLDVARLAPLLPYLKLLLAGLYTLPLRRETVFRGVRGDYHLDYDGVGAEPFTWWCFTSTSFDAHVARSPPFLGESGKRMFFTIDAMGVDITLYSSHGGERELLLLPGSKFRVSRSVPARHGPGAADTIWRYDLVAVDTQSISFSHPHWNKHNQQ